MGKGDIWGDCKDALIAAAGVASDTVTVQDVLRMGQALWILFMILQITITRYILIPVIVR